MPRKPRQKKTDYILSTTDDEQPVSNKFSKKKGVKSNSKWGSPKSSSGNWSTPSIHGSTSEYNPDDDIMNRTVRRQSRLLKISKAKWRQRKAQIGKHRRARSVIRQYERDLSSTSEEHVSEATPELPYPVSWYRRRNIVYHTSSIHSTDSDIRVYTKAEYNSLKKMSGRKKKVAQQLDEIQDTVLSSQQSSTVPSTPVRIPEENDEKSQSKKKKKQHSSKKKLKKIQHPIELTEQQHKVFAKQC